MRTSKYEGLIYIYNSLILGQTVNKQALADKLRVSTKTISRYINDLNAYFSNQEGINSIKYNRNTGGYYLAIDDDLLLGNQEVYLISKILIEAKVLDKAELQRLLAKLFSQFHKEDRQMVRHIINGEINQYQQVWKSENMITRLWDCSLAIRQGKELILSFEKEDVTIAPLEIAWLEDGFYLLGYHMNSQLPYPCSFRLDTIKSYKISDKHFGKRENQNLSGNIRDFFHFPSDGALTRYIIKSKQKHLRSIFEKFSKAKVVNISEGEYFIEVISFGKGIKNWILTKPDVVELISPGEMRKEIRETALKLLQQYS